MASHDVCLTVEAARAMIAAPHLHGASALRRSIEVLKTKGDWMDFERAKMLERQLDAETFRPTAGEVVADVVGVLALFAFVICGFWVGAGLGWQ